MQAESVEHALAHLRTRALFVTSLEPSKTARGVATAAFSLLPVGQGARLALFRSLATLVRAGVPLRRALEITIEQCRNARLSEALRSVTADIESGTALSMAMSRRPREFSPLFIAMIRAGELGGVLDEVLERLAAMLELERSMQKRLSAAFAYPIVVTVAATVLVLFLIANVVPAFAGLFAEMHVALPLSTRILIGVGNGLRSPLTVTTILGVLLSVISGLRIAWSHPKGALALDRLALALPIVGTLLQKAIVARFSRTLGSLLRSGVALLGALDACEGVVGSVLYAACVRNVSADLREGHAITVPLAKSKLFDPLFMQLVRVGEETGTLDSMLLRVAEYFELDVESALAAFGSVVEPLLIIFLGAVVGAIVASVLIPLYSIIGSIK
jgi:type IV pilus assembly protein PilC